MRVSRSAIGCTALLLLFSGSRCLAQEAAPAVQKPAADSARPQPRAGFTGLAFRLRSAPAGTPISERVPPSVAWVQPGSPAASAGLHEGDVMLQVNGKDSREPGMMRFLPGERYIIRVRRGEQDLELVLVPAVRPADGGMRP